MKNHKLCGLLSIKIAYIRSNIEINTKQCCWITKCVDVSLQFYFHCADILSDNEVIRSTLAYTHLHVIMGVLQTLLARRHKHTQYY